MRYLVTYADEAYAARQKVLATSAFKHGFDEVLLYGPKDIPQDFYAQNATILSKKRGNGYWLWKPYLILKTMQAVPEGSTIIYLDSGMEILANFAPIFDIIQAVGYWFVDVRGKEKEHTNGMWTKGDCFAQMKCLAEPFRRGRQANAAYQGYKNSDWAKKFVAEYLGWCQRPELITDSPSVHPNYPEFKDHRHDQSILSLQTQWMNLQRFRDPSQFGNSYFGEYPNSRYGQLVDHYRVELFFPNFPKTPAWVF